MPAPPIRPRPGGKRDELFEAREFDDALDLVARYFG